MTTQELEALAAKLLVFGFEGLAPTEDALSLVQRGAAGAILFKRNVQSPAQVFALNQTLRAAAQRPFSLSVDQEGGRVARLREGFSTVPSLRRIGESDDPARARRVGNILGRECHAVGFDLDFAPVVDVDSNPANPVIGDRSFGRDPQLCGRLGAAMIRGLQDAGIAACAKHFPGHGDTHQDSHRDLPKLTHPLGRLEAVELPPFRAAVAAGVATIMTAHVVFTALDETLPATLSQKTLGSLRRAIGFDGVMVSDDLEMAAVADLMETGEAAVLAVEAGCDLLLVCHRAARQHAAIDALIAWGEENSAHRERLQQAAGRVDELLQRFATRAATTFDPSALRVSDDVAFLETLATSEAGPDPTEA